MSNDFIEDQLRKADEAAARGDHDLAAEFKGNVAFYYGAHLENYEKAIEYNEKAAATTSREHRKKGFLGAAERQRRMAEEDKQK